MKQTAAIAVTLWLRIWVFDMEVPGLNPGTFLCNFYPMVAVLLDYLNPKLLHLFVFLLCTVALLLLFIK